MLLTTTLYSLFVLAMMADSEATIREWKFVTLDEDANRHFVDESSVKLESGNVLSAWVRYEYEKPPAHQARLEAIEALENFDCDRRVRQIIIVLAYLSDGRRIVENKVLPWRDVPAGSTSEMELELVCSVSSEASLLK